MHRILGLLLVTALTFTAALMTSSASSADPATGAAARTAADTTYVKQVRQVTNNKRRKGDLKPLTAHACLNRFAQQQAKRMANQRRLFHQDLGPVLRQCGMRVVGENVAYGYATGRAVVNGWMGSPDHRRNIMRPGFRKLGVGVVRQGGTVYAVQVFGTPHR